MFLGGFYDYVVFIKPPFIIFKLYTGLFALLMVASKISPRQVTKKKPLVFVLYLEENPPKL